MRYLIFILWLLLGLLYYWICTQCCGNAVVDKTSAMVPAAAATAPCPDITAYSFNWDGINPVQEKSTNYGDLGKTLLSGLKNNQILQITGLYRDGESNETSYENIGLARANNFAKLINAGSEKVKLIARKINAGARAKDCAFAGVQTKALVTSANVIEEEVKDKFGNISTRTTIYFPFNSTNKLNNKEVENYLNDVASRVKSSGERVQLTGHTDNVGPDNDNMSLGQRRADIVKRYLVSKGVSASKIIANSKGESSPVATNDTSDGRQKNRRTELQIIK